MEFILDDIFLQTNGWFTTHLSNGDILGFMLLLKTTLCGKYYEPLSTREMFCGHMTAHSPPPPLPSFISYVITINELSTLTYTDKVFRNVSIPCCIRTMVHASELGENTDIYRDEKSPAVYFLLNCYHLVTVLVRPYFFRHGIDTYLVNN